MLSQKYFYTVLILLFLSPIFFHLNLLTTGKKAVGTVVRYRPGHRYYISYPEIQYSVGDWDYTMLGPQNIRYEMNKKIIVLYEDGKPENSMLYNIEYIYVNNLSIVPAVLLIIWVAFYSAFKKIKGKKAKKENEAE